MLKLVQQLREYLFLLPLYPGGPAMEQDPVTLSAVQL